MSMRRFGLNTIYQLCGQITPILVGIFTVPFLLRILGKEQFGVYSIVLFTTNFLLLLDLGAGRAVTRFASIEIRDRKLPQLAATLATSSLFLLLFSIACVGVAIAFLPAITQKWFNVPAAERAVLAHCLLFLLGATPVIILTGVARSYLEAREKFASINILTGFFGALNYAAPLLAALITDNVLYSAVTFVAVGLFRFFAFLFVAGWDYRFFWARPSFDLAHVRQYGRFLGWLSVANVLGSVIAYADRFVASNTVPVSYLPYYTIPLDFISRSLIVSNSLSGVLLPYFSARWGSREYGATIERIFIILSTVIPPAFMIFIVVAPVLLELWLGHEFRSHSAVLGDYFIIGCAISSINVVLMAKVTADGHSDRLALLYAIELCVYSGALLMVGPRYGLAGIAKVWASRSAIEYVIFAWILFRDNQCRRNGLVMTAAVVLPVNFLIMVLISLCHNDVVRAVIASGGIIAGFMMLWFWGGETEMRLLLRAARWPAR